MKDYYLEDPRRLNGMPKKTIGDYVESNGILVPRRYEFEEAKKSKLPVFVRTERAEEYDGISGLGESFMLDNPNYKTANASSMEELKDLYFEAIDSLQKIGIMPAYKKYCRYTSTGIDDFREESKFSLWEGLGGMNWAVTADSAIPGRWHIMTKIDNLKQNYTIYENGKITQYINKLPKDMENGFHERVELYESVRNLDNFDPQHCPIIEGQTVDGKHYFLQYHRVRDFDGADFVIDREPGKAEIDASFVRGKTGKDGMDVKFTAFYADPAGAIRDYPANEDGSMDAQYKRVFSELMVRKRKFQLIETNKDGWEYALEGTGGHGMRSRLYKPEVSVLNDSQDIISGDEMTKMIYNAINNREDQQINLHVLADGRRSYIRRI